MNLPSRALWVVRWLARWWPRGTDRRDPVTWIWKAWRERSAPGGKVLAGIWLLALPVSVLTRGYAGGLVLAGASALLVASMLLSLPLPRGIARARVPGSLREGESASVVVEVEMASEGLPVGTGAWIFRTGDGLSAEGDGAVVRETGAGSGRVEVPLRALRRGVHVVEGPTLMRLDPLGLFRSRKLFLDPREVEVLPSVLRVVSLEGVMRGPGESEMARAIQGEAALESEVSGIRPWREGDGPRDVHHRSWARTGRLAAVERIPDAGEGVALILDTTAEGWRRALQEEAIRLCAGIARFLEANGSLSEFHLDGASVDLSGGSKIRKVESALAALAPPIDWKRRRAPPGPRRIPTTTIPVVALGFSAEPPPGGTTPSPERRVWVDWGEGPLPPGVLRIDPRSCRDGEVRL